MDIRNFFGKNDDDATTSSAISGDAIASSASEKNIEQESESKSDAEENQNENQGKNREQNPAERQKKDPVRKYNESYLEYGFICDSTGKLPLPQCLLCSAVFKNSAMKPAPLKNHLLTVHKDEPDTSLDFFKLKQSCPKKAVE